MTYRRSSNSTPVKVGPRRVGIYLRQSKDVEGTHYAVDRQEKDCRQQVAYDGDEVVAVFMDNDTSATTGKKRKDFERMKEAARTHGVDYVIAQNLDRLLRSNIELEELVVITEQTGTEFRCVTSPLDLTTPDGRTTARVLASIARGEVEKKNARQRRAGLQRAEDGRAPRNRSFGFGTDGEPDPVEGPIVADLMDKVIGGMPLNAVRRWLNTNGYTTVNGKEWGRSSVHYMLTNPRNAGLRVYYGEVIATGTWTPIVTPEVHRAVCEALAANPPRREKEGNARKWIGSGLYRCGVEGCNDRMKSKMRNGGRRLYACAGPRQHLTRDGEGVDAVVRTFMEKLLAREDLVDRVTPTGDTRIAGLRAEAQTVRLRIEQVEADYADQDPADPDRMTWADMKRLTKPNRDRLDVLNTMMTEAAASSALARLVAAGDPVAYWKEQDVRTQQVIVDAVCTVTILPAPRGSKVFDPSLVVIAPKNVPGQLAAVSA